MKKPETESVVKYEFPKMSLMETDVRSHSEGVSELDKERMNILIETLNNFGIPSKAVGISHGPAVTRLEILPDPSIPLARVTKCEANIKMELEATAIRIEAPIPGKRAVGVEVPNARREVVHLRDVLESPEVLKNNKLLMVALGMDNGGKYVVADLAKMPHVLIAGQTGSGKSVCINAFIISLLYRTTPEQVRMIMIDPKKVELNVYNKIPHLLVPVVTDPKKAAGALDWALCEMNRRYSVFEECGAKNIESYNEHHLKPGETPMPRIVIIIDELADLMMTAKHEVEESICHIAQLARAAGMHLVIATQRPSVNVVTGLIKANVPTRIAFTVTSSIDSMTILDSGGAEKLLGRGDMFYQHPEIGKPLRMQGAWVSEEEVQRVVDAISKPEGNEFDSQIIKHLEDAAKKDDKKSKSDESPAPVFDELFERALREAVEAGQISISMLQRKLKVGYPRAGKLIDEMEERGYISKGEGSKPRTVLITREEVDQLFPHDNNDEQENQPKQLEEDSEEEDNVN